MNDRLMQRIELEKFLRLAVKKANSVFTINLATVLTTCN